MQKIYICNSSESIDDKSVTVEDKIISLTNTVPTNYDDKKVGCKLLFFACCFLSNYIAVHTHYLIQKSDQNKKYWHINNVRSLSSIS